MPTTHTHYIELKDPCSPEQLHQALEAAGLKVWETREVSKNHDGVIITDTLLQGIWRHETDYARCHGHCIKQQGRLHVPYDDLTPDQRDAFAHTVANFMEFSRQTSYNPEQLLLDEEDFEKIALKSCKP